MRFDAFEASYKKTLADFRHLWPECARCSIVVEAFCCLIADRLSGSVVEERSLESRND